MLPAVLADTSLLLQSLLRREGAVKSAVAMALEPTLAPGSVSTTWHGTSGLSRHQKKSRKTKVAVCHKTEGTEQTKVAMLFLNISLII